ncbi:hypothetical protein SO802_017821 [Lithocarpus litseifolius]|uniref:Uncharacterized protein n=1 Tax=Lithocarpus litseifolius TaxID=425828 RepID=A0AAW2CKD9_9ROSI
MGYPFPKGTRAPTVQEHEELVWLAGNLKLEVTEYSRRIYGPGGSAYPSGNDDGDDGAGGSETTPSYPLRKRRYQ